MNEKVRRWIRHNAQPWAWGPDLSMAGGKLGDPGTANFGEDAKAFYEERYGKYDGVLIEDLQEREFLDLYGTILSCLSEADQCRLSQDVGFGVAQILEANACAFPCEGAIGILYDLSLFSLLAGTAELWVAAACAPHLLNGRESFDRLYVHLIVWLYFNLAGHPGWPIRLPSALCEVVNKMAYLENSFVIAHELGHVLKGHLAKHRLRDVNWRDRLGAQPLSVYSQSFEEEFEADLAAVEILTSERGSWETQTRDVRRWHGVYMAFGAVLTKLYAIELLARRIGIPMKETHPPAEDRRLRVLEAFRARVQLPQEVVSLEAAHHKSVQRAVTTGQIPQMDAERLKKVSELHQILGL